MLIIPDKFVFVHMPKTGGQWAKRVLKEAYADGERLQWQAQQQRLGWHAPASRAGDVDENTIFGFVRNPWDWYVSWFRFLNSQMKHTAWLLDRDSFESFVRRLLTLSDDDIEARDARGKLTLQVSAQEGPGLPPFGIFANELGTIKGSGEGYYTWLFKHTFDAPCRVYRYEDGLSKMVVRAVENAGVDANDRLLKLAAETPKVNSAWTPVDYRTFYDKHPDLAQLIAERESYVINRFGYSYEGESWQSQKMDTSQSQSFG